MNEILDKLKSVVLALEKEHQPILFFALFLREDSLQKWDIVISAPWLNPSEMHAYQIIASKLQATLSSSEIIEISRAVILDHTDPAILFLQEVCPLTNGGFKESPKDFSVEPLSEKFGFTIKKAYILRCQKL